MVKTSHPKITRNSQSHRLSATGREIIASLQEAIDVERRGISIDSRFTVRTVELPAAPKSYSPEALRATRDEIGVSRTIFAHLLGVSAVAVRAWKQGNRIPA